ncbi:MAG: YdcF family protein [bacterium]
MNNPEKSDAICILLGDFRVRPLRAAELYHRGFADQILIVDYPEDMLYGSLESQLAQVMTMRAGVPLEKLILIRGKVTSTREEARFYREYAEEHQLKSLLIVTSSFHTRRSRWIFQKVFAESDIKLSFAAARQPFIDETNWYLTDEGLVTYFSETLKTLYYFLRY